MVRGHLLDGKGPWHLLHKGILLDGNGYPLDGERGTFNG